MRLRWPKSQRGYPMLAATRVGKIDAEARHWISACLLGSALLSAGCEPGERSGDLAAGRALYQARCQACHGEGGEKPANGDAGVIRDLSGAAVVETLERYQDPPEGAPWWTALKSGLTDQEIRDVAACFPLAARPVRAPY